MPGGVPARGVGASAVGPGGAGGGDGLVRNASPGATLRPAGAGSGARGAGAGSASAARAARRAPLPSAAPARAAAPPPWAARGPASAAPGRRAAARAPGARLARRRRGRPRRGARSGRRLGHPRRPRRLRARGRSLGRRRPGRVAARSLLLGPLGCDVDEERLPALAHQGPAERPAPDEGAQEEHVDQDRRDDRDEEGPARRIFREGNLDPDLHHAIMPRRGEANRSAPRGRAGARAPGVGLRERRRVG